MKLTIVVEIDPPDEKAVELLSTPVARYSDLLKRDLEFLVSSTLEDILDTECVDVDLVSILREKD